jgi:predicted nucleotidyltransferase
MSGDLTPEAKAVYDIVVPAIVRVTPPLQEIWFYGSRARGDHRPDSDYDFLAILPNSEIGGALVYSLSSTDGPFAKMTHLIPNLQIDIQPAFDTNSIAGPLTWARTEGRRLWAYGARLY